MKNPFDILVRTLVVIAVVCGLFLTGITIFRVTRPKEFFQVEFQGQCRIGTDLIHYSSRIEFLDQETGKIWKVSPPYVIKNK